MAKYTVMLTVSYSKTVEAESPEQALSFAELETWFTGPEQVGYTWDGEHIDVDPEPQGE